MTADILFRKAQAQDLPQIWEILQQAIQRRKEEGKEVRGSFLRREEGKLSRFLA